MEGQGSDELMNGAGAWGAAGRMRRRSQQYEAPHGQKNTQQHGNPDQAPWMARAGCTMGRGQDLGFIDCASNGVDTQLRCRGARRACLAHAAGPPRGGKGARRCCGHGRTAMLGEGQSSVVPPLAGWLRRGVVGGAQQAGGQCDLDGGPLGRPQPAQGRWRIVNS